MKFRSNSSPSSWLNLWLDKYAAELVKCGCSPDDALAYAAVVRTFLIENPGNPRQIPLSRLQKFIADSSVTIPALILFYEQVAYSESHLEVLRTGGTKKRGSAGSRRKSAPRKSS